MTGWRDPILQNFTPEIASVARLTIVSDPDELLGEPGVVEGIRAQGFEIIAFDDHVRFRYAYEQRFRRFWDGGEKTTLVVVLRAGQQDVNALPYDLLEEAKRQSRVLSFSLAELFPNLQPQVLAQLDRSDLDTVHAAQETHAPGQLGTNATREFVLRHVFQVAPDLIVDQLRRDLEHMPQDELACRIGSQLSGCMSFLRCVDRVEIGAVQLRQHLRLKVGKQLGETEGENT